MPKAIIYTRVSTDVQERDGTSLDSQERDCLAYCRDRGYDVLEVVSDAVSSKDLARPGLDRLREMVRAKSAGVVVAHQLDRLVRSQNHCGIILDEMSRSGAHLELVKEEFEDTAIGRFVLAARAFMAEVEREKIGNRTKAGRRERARSGSYIPARAPYGYTRVGTGRLDVDGPKASVVMDIFRRFVEGESYRGIAVALNALGVPSSMGKPWERQVIKKMLTNESYTGVLSYMDVRIEDGLPVIIDRETFDRVQRQIASRVPRGGGRGARSSHLLTGLIYCYCGSRMHGRTHRKGTVPRVYTCSMYSKSGVCRPDAYDAEWVEREAVDAIHEITADLPRLNQLRTDAITRIRADLAIVEASLRQNEVERQHAIRAIRDGKPFAHEAAQSVVDDRSRLLDARAEIESRIAQAEADREHDSRMTQEVKKLLDEGLPILTRKRILSEALASSRVVVTFEGVVSIE